MTPIEQAIEEEARGYVAPVQVYALETIRATLTRIGRSLGSTDRLLFAVKSFPASTVLQAAFDCGTGFEISSRSEYELLPADLAGSTVSLNAPGPADLASLVSRGNRLHVHLDSPQAADGIAVPDGASLALRLSHTALEIPTDGTGAKRPSRFGATPQSFVESAPLFRSGRLQGVHVHNGSEANTPGFYRAALTTILSIARDHEIPLAYINLGGGLHPLGDAELSSLLPQLNEAAGAITLYLEPGNVVSRDAGTLLARVLAVREVERNRFMVTLDASYECHAKWSDLAWGAAASHGAERHSHDSIPKVGAGREAWHFNGASCHEHDVLGVYTMPAGTGPAVAVGDVITFVNLSGYSLAWNTSFNGVPPARVRFV